MIPDGWLDGRKKRKEMIDFLRLVSSYVIDDSNKTMCSDSIRLFLVLCRRRCRRRRHRFSLNRHFELFNLCCTDAYSTLMMIIK